MKNMAVGVNVLFWFVALCVFCCPTHGDKTDNEARVLILGAGAAGLQAARSLHDAGMDDFIIVEADERIGGRVESTAFAGRTVELGPTWALPQVSRVVNIVQKLNLTNRASDYDSLAFRNESGQDVTEEAEAHYDRIGPAKDKLGSLREKMIADDGIPDMSQRSALRAGGWIPHTPTEWSVEWFEFDVTHGDAPERYSTKNTEFIGEEYWMTDPRGLKQIFYDVAGFLHEPAYANHTRLKKRVTSIDYSNDISVVVTCEDGTRYISEYVLVTFSLGVLQNNLIQFVPPLPEWKDVQIKKSLMVTYTLIYVSFPVKFWDDAEWILHVSNRRGFYPVFFNFQAEGFDPNGTPTLLALVTGDEAQRVESQSPAETKAEIQDVLRGMYGDGIPEATNILVTDWLQNPLTKGSYSGFPVEVNTECFPKLESRVGRVFFGGEATSLKFFGTIDGALESGEREAKKILGCMSNFEECPYFEGNSLECDPSAANTLQCSKFVFSLLMGLFLNVLLA